MKRGRVNKNHLFFLLLLLLVFNGSYTYKRKTTILQEGSIASKDIIAQYTFKILKTKQKLEEEKKEASENVPPILQYIGFPDSIKVVSEIDSIIRNEAEDSPLKWRILRNKKYIINNFISIYKDGIVSDKLQLPESKGYEYMVIKDDTGSLVSVEKLRDLEESHEYLEARIRKMLGSSRYFNGIIEGVNQYIKPNLLIDYAETEKRREKARNAVSDSLGVVRKGEKIVGAHEVVTQDAYRKLYSLSQKESRKFPHSLLSTIIRNQLYFLLIGLFILVFIYIRLEKVYRSRRYLYLFVINMLLILLLYRLFPLYLLPMASVVMFFTLAVDLDFGILIAISSSLIISLYQGFTLERIIPVLTGSLVGGILLIDSNNREDWYRTGAIVSITTALLIISIEFYNRSPLSNILTGAGYGLINGFLSILILFALLFIFERTFNITTNFTWMEYSDLNNPLLKRLSREASGTYQHALMVSNLAENVAEVVGANPLLSKVAGLYHDIGKLERPEYFAENFKNNFNPHDSIPPALSAIIIKSHIKEGVRIAREFNLPDEIIDIIEQHQGNSLIIPFYEKAKIYYDEINDDDYRYDTGIPVSKEAGIIMLADIIEATARSMDKPTEEEIKEMIKSQIYRQFSKGQLSKSELSIKDLEDISTQFLQTLQGLHHYRPVYPESE